MLDAVPKLSDILCTLTMGWPAKLCATFHLMSKQYNPRHFAKELELVIMRTKKAIRITNYSSTLKAKDKQVSI